MANDINLESWTCEMCTMANEPGNMVCFMCQSPRIQLKDLSVKWEWHPNPDQWLAYDLDSIMEIENAYKNEETSVNLTRGWFAAHRGYIIDFSKNVQISPNGNERPIRRIGNDDESIFICVKAGEEGYDKCVICQFEFDTAEGASEDIVRLKVCSGHGFHRECIKGWVNLHSRCPLCNIEL